MKRGHIPPHVTIILDGELRIVGADAPLRQELLAAGLEAHRRRDGLSIAFEPSGDESDLANGSLIEALRVLAAHGVAFSADYKQGWSPAEVVAELLDRGVDFESPAKVGFDGSTWHRFPITRA